MNKVCHFLLILFPFVALAQQDVPLPPTAPFVVNAPNLARWSVTYKSKATRDQHSPAQAGDQATSGGAQPQTPLRELKEMTVTKAGTTRRMVSTWSDGTTSEEWIIEGLQLQEQPGQPDIYMFTTNQSSLTMADYSKSDFPELSWLSGKNYVGVESINKIQCWSFQGTDDSQEDSRKLPMLQISKKGDQEAKPAPEMMRKAWISTDTKLPVAMYDGEKLQVFTFHPAPNQAPEMPTRFANLVKGYQETQKALENKYRMKP